MFNDMEMINIYRHLNKIINRNLGMSKLITFFCLNKIKEKKYN